MTSLLNRLPPLGLRPAGGLSSRLGCHVLGHRGPNAVVRPWVTRRQMGFPSDTDALDYNDPGHYATLGLMPSASPEAINKAWSKSIFDLHSDITGKKSTAATEKLLRIRAAGNILRYPERKAKYDVQHGFNKPAQPSMAAKQQRVAGTQRGSIGLRDSFLRHAAGYRQQQQRKEARDKMAARAAARAQAAEAKKRDEARKAQELADRAISKAKAEAEAQKLADKKRANEEEDPAIRAARAADKEKADEEAAALSAARRKAGEEAAARSKAAAQARKAELAKQRERGARLVVLRHVPAKATPWAFAKSLRSNQVGRILDMGCKKGSAWVEFFTAEQATAFHRFIAETGRFSIGDTRILNAEIRQGTVPSPQGPELITRCLRIAMPQEFLKFLHPDEPLDSLMARKLRERGFRTTIVSCSWGHMSFPNGKWLFQNHFSVAQAQSTKAAIEECYPQLGVAYVEDCCGGLPQTGREDTAKGSRSDKKEPKTEHWLAPRPFEVLVAAVVCAIGVWMDMGKGKSSDDKKQ